MIKYDELNHQFNIYTENTQLSIGVLASGHLVKLYHGKKMNHESLKYATEHLKHAGFLASTDEIDDFQLELLPLVMPTYGNSDLRTPAIQLDYGKGNAVSDFRYADYNIYQGKQKIKGLPSTFAADSEVMTLEIVLEDPINFMELKIIISSFSSYDVITQHVCLTNKTGKQVNVERALSINLDIPHSDFDLVHLSGSWTRETHIQRHALHKGFQGIDSKRGASGHGQNPFVALVEKHADFDHGQVIGLNLVYSGNFLASAEVDMFDTTRLQMGINPFEFSWVLEDQESFSTPEVVMVYTEEGLNSMSHIYHRFYEECLVNQHFAKKNRPILINNWEATYFDFTYDKLMELAVDSASVGIELFVLDDGWFGARNSDKTSLGDWAPNEEKLGGSLAHLIKNINDLGLDFGLWVEPEMISKESQLYQEHPDWIIRQSNRQPQESRNQYVLDLSRGEVQDFIIEMMTDLLAKHHIKYIKWDMNRNITDLGTSNPEVRHVGELSHRYMLGLYRILTKITEAFPEVLIESCAGGGGRFDPAMLFYTPQIWTSDNTDAIERLKIQAGNSLVYPPSSMGCHISEVPNHQVLRETPLKTREIVAYQGNFGFELDLTKMTKEEKEELSKIVSHYKQHRELFQFGKHIRLDVYDKDNQEAWMKIKDETAIVSHVYVLAKPNCMAKRLKLKGLEANANYQIDEGDRLFSGSELMNVGLALVKPSKDFLASTWKLKKIQE